MVGTADSIRKEIDAIESTTAKMAEELQERYRNYLEMLGTATKRQLILASFQLCTQAYPEAFLKLTVGQREQLQKNLRGLGEEGKERLLGLLEASQNWQSMSIEELPPALMAALEKEHSDGAADTGDSEDEATEATEATDSTASPADDPPPANDDPAPQSEEEEEEDIAVEEPMMKAMLMNAVMEALEANRAAEGDALTPSRLAQRYLMIERQIRNVLQDLTKAANFVLQNAKVLPNLPDAILAAAAEAEVPADKASSPNMLNVLIDMEAGQQDLDESDDDDDDGSETAENSSPRAMAHLVALNLRLSDIEFADTRLSMARNQLRQVLAKLKRMAGKYRKKQRQLSIAEAESAWRSVWYD